MSHSFYRIGGGAAHVMIRPGASPVMNWEGPLLRDCSVFLRRDFRAFAVRGRRGYYAAWLLMYDEMCYRGLVRG